MNIELVHLLDKQMTKQELAELIRYELGSSNPDYFKAVKKKGLKLQQVPEEYSELLYLLKEEIKPATYLELGIGNGGSWLVTTYFIKSIVTSVAVDNLAYGELIGQNLEEVVEIEKFFQLQALERKISSIFYYKTTEKFFQFWGTTEKFDVLFIDADHSYDGVKFDYQNSLFLVKEGGYLIFHDIVSKGAPGVVKLWNEIKEKHGQTWEFIHSDTCGIGVIKIDKI